MTLTSYYEKLPERTAPKTEFVERLAKRCGLKETTIRMWIKYGVRPSRRYRDIVKRRYLANKKSD